MACFAVQVRHRLPLSDTKAVSISRIQTGGGSDYLPRQRGFHDCMDTEAMFGGIFAGLQQERILPPA
jgi:hypothetical protein